METAAKDGAAPSTQHGRVRPPIGALRSAVDVLLVGCGPVGATIAKLLARYGVHVLVIDKSTKVLMAPRAIALDNEALRILQLAGIEERDFETIAIPFVRMRSPTLGLFGRVNSLGGLDGRPTLVTFYQPDLERCLRTRLETNKCAQILTLTGFGVDAAASLDLPTAAAFARAAGHVVQIAHRGQRLHLARPDSWEDLESVFLPGLVPVGVIAVVRPARTIVHDGPATETNRVVCESLALLGDPVGAPTLEAEPAL